MVRWGDMGRLSFCKVKLSTFRQLQPKTLTLFLAQNSLSWRHSEAAIGLMVAMDLLAGREHPRTLLDTARLYIFAQLFDL